MNKRYDKLLVPLCGKGIMRRLENSSITVWVMLGGVLFCFLVFGSSCKDDAVATDPVFTFSIEDVAVTEVWLRVISNVFGSITIRRGEETILADLASPVDTVIYDNHLSPNHEYKYTASVGNNTQYNSTLTTRTMDSTSHNIQWQIDTLSVGGYSTLNDVAIINDTLVYAVGEINMEDSLGNWRMTPFNVAKWDGHGWEYFTTEDSGYGYGENYSIFAFGADDYWIGSSIPEHWDGKKWTFYGSSRNYPGGFRIWKIWGTSSQNLYVVGEEGNIRFYNGYYWRKIESGTDLDIWDIYGAYNERVKKYEVLAIAFGRGNRNEWKILQINGTTVSTVSDYSISYSLKRTWFIPEHRYYVVGYGIYEKRTLSDYKWVHEILEITPYPTTDVYGTALNDVFFVGSHGDCLHYNGISYKSYIDEGTRINGVYSAVRANKNLIVAVGYVNDKACALIGRR